MACRSVSPGTYFIVDLDFPLAPTRFLPILQTQLQWLWQVESRYLTLGIDQGEAGRDGTLLFTVTAAKQTHRGGWDSCPSQNVP